MSAPGRPRLHLILAPAVAACLMVVVLSACGGSVTTAPTEADRKIRKTATAEPATTKPTASTTTSPPAKTPAKGQEEEVKAAYLKAYAVYFEVAKSPNPDDKRLAMTRAGPSLARVEDLLRGFRESRVHVKYPDGKPPTPTVLAVDAASGTSTLRACLVDDGVQVRNDGGAVVDDTPVSRLSEAKLRLSAGSWIVYTERGIQQWLDSEGCDR